MANKGLKGTENSEVRTGRAIASFLFFPVGAYTYAKLKNSQPDKANTYGLLCLAGLVVFAVNVARMKMTAKTNKTV
jgi:hypothetical protein